MEIALEMGRSLLSNDKEKLENEEERREEEVNVTEIHSVSDVISPDVTLNDASFSEEPGKLRHSADYCHNNQTRIYLVYVGLLGSLM